MITHCKILILASVSGLDLSQD